MKEYEIFKSEGGYRVCGGVWCGGPIIAQSPWFATRQDAERRAEEMRKEYIERAALDIVAGSAPARLYPAEAQERARQIKAEVANQLG